MNLLQEIEQIPMINDHTHILGAEYRLMRKRADRQYLTHRKMCSSD